MWHLQSYTWCILTIKHLPGGKVASQTLSFPKVANFSNIDCAEDHVGPPYSEKHDLMSSEFYKFSG